MWTSKFPWNPLIGLVCIQTVCLQLNPIGGSQGDFEIHTQLIRVNFREMAFSYYQCISKSRISTNKSFLSFQSMIYSWYGQKLEPDPKWVL